MTKQKCDICGRPTTRIQPLVGIPICVKCWAEPKTKDKYKYITKTRVRTEYRLKDKDIENTPYYEVDNPHYKKAAPMKLFLFNEIEALAKNKWGNTEPYIVKLIDLSKEWIEWFLQDIERIKSLNPREFELLIAERLDKMNFNVKLVGDTFEKDGGIDIIATPKNSPFPYILAVQAKHHRTNRKTVAKDVRDFLGALSNFENIFSIGMLVTNTEFTPDTDFYVQNKKPLLRLRDNYDLKRWLQEDFDNECNWREMPSSIILPNKKEIFIPTDKIIIPKKYDW